MSKYGFNLAALVLLGALIYLLVRIALGLAAPSSLWKPLTAPMNATGGSAANAAQARAYDFSFDPFSTRSETSPRVAALGEDAPETTLQLTLMGMITGADGAAILRTADGSQARYAIEDEILGGVTLEAVNATFVVLNVNGQIQRLTFDRDSDPLITSKITPLETSPAPLLSGKKVMNAPTSMAELGNVLSFLSIKPVSKNGKVIGQSVQSSNAAFPVAQLGIEPNDVFTQIGSVNLARNGVELQELVEVLYGQSTITASVIRDGREQIIRLGQ